MTVDQQTSQQAVADQKPVPRRRDIGLMAIAIFKLVKGVLLFAVGVGALTLLHKDVAAVAEHWIDQLRVDPNNRHVHSLLFRLGLVNARKLEELSAGTFFYSGLLLTEGTGLLLRKRWAEYFTIIVTGSFLPMEIYELIRRLTYPRVLLLVVNIVIVWYLVKRLIHDRKTPSVKEAGQRVASVQTVRKNSSRTDSRAS